MNSPDPSNDQHAAMSEALRHDAARIQPPPFDIALHRATMRRIQTLASATPQPWNWWLKPPLAGLAAVVLVASGIALWLARDSQRTVHRTAPRQDFDVVLASAQTTVASLSADTLSPMPAWMSPTASLLDLQHNSTLNLK